ncbi:hypothetical protein D1872_288860 [compost metagenome]
MGSPVEPEPGDQAGGCPDILAIEQLCHGRDAPFARAAGAGDFLSRPRLGGHRQK